MDSAGRIIVINEKDNVGTALDELAAGATVSLTIEDSVEKMEIVTPIPKGHKVALKQIGRGEPVIKYGETIGKSTMKIARGEHVHVHNVVSQPKGGKR